MAKLRPLGDKILVKRVEAESKTKSGIVLPVKRVEALSVADGDNLASLGLFLGAVGEDNAALGLAFRLDSGEKAPFTVKKGDEVIFTSYAGTEIKIDGEEVLIMSEDDVLAVVE
jgi:chaperonin GroES